MLTDKQEGLQSIIDKSFQLFLSLSKVLEKDDLQETLFQAQIDEAFVNISPGIYSDPCQWLISLDNEKPDPSRPYMREYILYVQYRIDETLTYESCYSLIKDIMRNQLYYFRPYTRIVESLPDGKTNFYLVREGNPGDDIGIHFYSK